MWTSVGHMRDNWALYPSPVSRSSASARHSGCGIRLSAHHFRYLQFPHLQVSLMASRRCFLFLLFSTKSTNALWLIKMKKCLKLDVWVWPRWAPVWYLHNSCHSSSSSSAGDGVKAAGKWAYAAKWAHTLFPNNPQCNSRLTIVTVFVKFVFFALLDSS